jgi:tRNA U55 pseudouridine synthase TruB
LGAALGTGGCLTALARTAVGPFRIDSAITLEQAEQCPPDDFVQPLSNVLEKLESAEANASAPRPGE